ncbi:serine hydrolase [Rhodocytophaga rosea]|uniref:Serine hydrolase n=1 Tax=Rhodocytophaga rosea TaxID=2704465 RepID=A0A6C0GEN5_9BACT|nr:serine hydrolase [Rhodocytophaga rosea]QHT66130.1 serine hydrolase [Rhodocytophaga rosea]
MFNRLLSIFFLLLLHMPLAFAQPTETNTNNLVEVLLRSNPELFSRILKDPAKYEVQILYTQIDRNKKNKPAFTQHRYRVDATQYFYPASTVKLSAVLLALEKINTLNINGLTKETTLRIDSAYNRQVAVTVDSTSLSGLPSIAHYIKKILLVSDNDAYNRLFEFMGQGQINENLYKKGFNDLRLLKRLQVGSTAEEDRYTNPFTFYAGDKIIYEQPLVFNPKEFPNKLTTIVKGKGYLQQEKLVNKPMDFSAMNYISIENLQGILRSLLFPEAVPARKRFELKQEDYQFVYKYMSMFPQESQGPVYDSVQYYKSYGKFFLYGNTKTDFPPHIRIFNKAGWAYGFLTDNAYVADFKNNVEFLLTATILVNEDGIFNDDQYEYETVGKPFLAALGKVIYEYELGRKKNFQPNLSKFRIDYTKQ